jgi:GNAT superfamily N-acetyltransferase
MLVRPATPGDAAAIAEVRIAAWRADYAGLVPQPHLDALDPAESAERLAQHLAAPEEGVTKRTVVATTPAGDVVGFATGGATRRAESACSHELWAIYVRPDVQHQGAGTRLLAATLDWLASVGATSLEVLVLRDNHPGRAFYEGLGGVLQPAAASFVVGDVVLPECVYAWPALEVLRARCRARLHPEDVDAQRDAASTRGRQRLLR